MWRFHFPSGRLLASKPLLDRCGICKKLLGKAVMWVLGLSVLVARISSRRFGEGSKVFEVLGQRHAQIFYNLCYASAGALMDIARPTTVLQYLKGILQLASDIFAGGLWEGMDWDPVHKFGLDLYAVDYAVPSRADSCSHDRASENIDGRTGE